MIHAYPMLPGFKEKSGTSEKAAREIESKASAIQAQVLDLFKKSRILAPEVASLLLGVDILSIRPRFTELKLLGYIRKMEKTTRNHNQKSVRLWEITEKGEVA